MTVCNMTAWSFVEVRVSDWIFLDARGHYFLYNSWTTDTVHCTCEYLTRRTSYPKAKMQSRNKFNPKVHDIIFWILSAISHWKQSSLSSFRKFISWHHGILPHSMGKPTVQLSSKWAADLPSGGTFQTEIMNRFYRLPLSLSLCKLCRNDFHRCIAQPSVRTSRD